MPVLTNAGAKPPCRNADPLLVEIANHARCASILIVDDQDVNLRVAEAFLRDDGYEQITLCKDAEQVPTVMRQCDPDVILLDIMMPRISGLEVLETIRTDPDTRHIPVIVLTASTDPQIKSSALKLGATDF